MVRVGAPAEMSTVEMGPEREPASAPARVPFRGSVRQLAAHEGGRQRLTTARHAARVEAWAFFQTRPTHRSQLQALVRAPGAPPLGRCHRVLLPGADSWRQSRWVRGVPVSRRRMAANGYMTTALVCFSQAIRGGRCRDAQDRAVHPDGADDLHPAVVVVPLRAWHDRRRDFSLRRQSARVAAGTGEYPGHGTPVRRVVAGVHQHRILSSTITLVFKRGESALSFFVSLSWLLGGVFYPRDVLPPLLQQVAQVLPITHTVDAMRAALLDGASTVGDPPADRRAGAVHCDRASTQPRRVQYRAAEGPRHRHARPPLRKGAGNLLSPRRRVS